MKRSGVIAILLASVLTFSLATTALAEETPLDTERMPEEAESLEMLEKVDPTEAPSSNDPTEEPSPSAEPTPSDSASTEPVDEPELPSLELDPAAEASPTADAAAGDLPEAPTSESAPSNDPSPVLNSKPSLDIAYSTMHLHQESPSAQIIWRNSVPASVAGYIWSVQSDGINKVFYVTYDRASTTLAAGALNGHIDSPGIYVLQCQPVDENQEPATEPARADLYVESSSLDLSITSDRTFPVPVGSPLTLAANISGKSADEVESYDWKPSAGASDTDGRTCRISSVTAGPTRYTCTALLRSGERVTGTIVVTGTELTCGQHMITLSDETDSLDVVWSNGVPEDSSIRYRWSVQGVSGVDLSARSGMSLPAKYLAGLPARENPYTVTCQAFSGATPISSEAVFHVQYTVPAVVSAAPPEMREMKRIMGDENGLVPNTGEDTWYGVQLFVLCAAAGVLSAGIFRCIRRGQQ